MSKSLEERIAALEAQATKATPEPSGPRCVVHIGFLDHPVTLPVDKAQARRVIAGHRANGKALMRQLLSVLRAGGHHVSESESSVEFSPDLPEVPEDEPEVPEPEPTAKLS